MIYRTYNGGMDPVKRVSRQMRENLAVATGNEESGWYFRVGPKHYWSNSKDPNDVTPHRA